MKWIPVLGVFVLTALFSIGSTFLVMEKNYENKASKVAENELDSSSKEAKKEKPVSIEDMDLSWVDAVHSKMLDEWKSGDKTFDERLVQKVMLDMTHQMGDTHVKKGSIVITSERIDNLMQIVEEHKEVFHYNETYLDILKRWGKSDFSAVYDDHELLHSFYDRCR
ncbi:DUF6241 domain-containing protein [Lysinibacillus sp. NPDC096418]|uniref:DUF6241 domain-containing protein n=1 Tax=Lysinibacillus sp. NPDC096418 TaxID=3364138 RepID=UPI0038295583